MEKILEVKGLSAGYGKKAILQAADFTVYAGEMIGIIGANGSGKSTLLKTLRGLLPPLRGHILYTGQDLQGLRAGDFSRRVGYLQQQSAFPFGYTAGEIVMTGRYPYLSWWQQEGEQDRLIVQCSMEYTGVADLADQPMQAISGGQRQRVLLAKVLAQQTPIMLLDEPATGLDIFYQEEIFRFARELCAAGKTILLVVHELSLAARFCSRLLLLGQHRLLADGAPAAVLTPTLLSQAYGTAVEVAKNPLTGHLDIFTPASTRKRQPESALRLLLENIPEGAK